MDRRTLLCGLTAWTFTVRLVATAQQAGKVYRVGYLGFGSGPTPREPLDAVRQTRRERGHVEGQNLAIEYRWAGQRDDHLPSAAADLVRLKVDVIVVVLVRADQVIE